MALRPHAELDEIEVGNAIRAEDVLHFLGVGQGCGLAVRCIGGHMMHLGRGYLYLAQQYFVGHAVVAVRVVGRHTAFVAPEYIDQLPVNLAAIGFTSKQAVKLFGGIAA